MGVAMEEGHLKGAEDSSSFLQAFNMILFRKDEFHQVFCFIKMETLDFDSLTITELRELMALVHLNVPKTIGRADAILRLKLRLLIDSRHPRALNSPVEGPGRVRAVLQALRTLEGAQYDTLGVPADSAAEACRGSRASQHYTMMVEPESFDDTLLTLVPQGTYNPHQVWFGLFPEPPFYRSLHAFSLEPVPDVVAAAKVAFRMMRQYHHELKQGRSVVEAIELVTAAITQPPFEPTWVEDVGLSGTSYARLMVTMPNGDIWSTVPFGLSFPNLVPLRVNDVSMPEYIELMDILKLNWEDDLEGLGKRNALDLLLRLGANFYMAPHRTHNHHLARITNLREIIDQHGMQGLQLQARAAGIVDWPFDPFYDFDRDVDGYKRDQQA